MSLSRDPAKARAWADRSRARALARSREQRRKPLPPRSAKREAAMVERRALVRRLLTERPRCEARWLCRGARAVDVHERLTRARGGDILDPDQAHMLTVCRACHDHITTHPAEAETRRLMLPSWHRCPPMLPCC